MAHPHPTEAGRCPRAACRGLLTVASEEQIAAGAPIWSCSSGHQGPRVLFGTATP